jgi:hypothetical protein
VRGVLICCALALPLGCGYAFTHGYRAVGGADRIHVAAFENLSGDPDLGAAVTAALREELRRRGADAGDAAPAVLVGEVRASPGVPSTASAATWRVRLDVRARLVVRGATVAERTVRREADHLGGADALETEGRRAVALRALAGDAARELLRALESP